MDGWINGCSFVGNFFFLHKISFSFYKSMLSVLTTLTYKFNDRVVRVRVSVLTWCGSVLSQNQTAVSLTCGQIGLGLRLELPQPEP